MVCTEARKLCRVFQEIADRSNWYLKTSMNSLITHQISWEKSCQKLQKKEAPEWCILVYRLVSRVLLPGYNCEIWYLEAFSLVICHITLKNEKTSHRLCSDNVINLQTVIKVHIQFYFVSTKASRSETVLCGFSCC